MKESGTLLFNQVSVQIIMSGKKHSTHILSSSNLLLTERKLVKNTEKMLLEASLEKSTTGLGTVPLPIKNL